MSRIVQQLMVYPPENLLLMSGPEYINTDDFPCPTCKGLGWHWGESQGESTKHNCVVCNGTGKVHAKITIEWRDGEVRK